LAVLYTKDAELSHGWRPEIGGRMNYPIIAMAVEYLTRPQLRTIVRPMTITATILGKIISG